MLTHRDMSKPGVMIQKDCALQSQVPIYMMNGFIMLGRICKYSAQSPICIPLSSRDNPFLLESLRCVLHRFGLPSQLQDISLTLKNEGGFYFMKDGKQTKTGFGSSSTTVIATIASLLLSFGICSFAFIAFLK